MLFSNFLLSLLCFPSVPKSSELNGLIDNSDLVFYLVDQEESRLFSKFIKDQCWQKFPKVPGRDPKRWRLDAVGNIVSYSMRGCDGCLCHEYDHIIPFSKGGRSILENCQILQQRVNRFKGNEDDDPGKLLSYSCQRKFSSSELDIVEMGLYGDIRDEMSQIKCRCKSYMEFEQAMTNFVAGNGQRPPKDSKKYPNCL